MLKNKKKESKNPENNTGEEAIESSHEDNVATAEQPATNQPSEVEVLKDKYLRLFAEFENYKKRTLRERVDLIKTASQSTITKILPILDDFDRAKKSADDESTDDQFPEGVELVYQKLKKTMEGLGLVAMDMGDGIFDDDFHDAITHIPTPDPEMSGKIIEVVEKGYLLNDKIVRHAKVVVGK